MTIDAPGRGGSVTRRSGRYSDHSHRRARRHRDGNNEPEVRAICRTPSRHPPRCNNRTEQDLSRRFRADEFDIAIAKEPVAGDDARASFPEPLAWFESCGMSGSWPDPIPLVTFPSGGLYRDLMIDRIGREQRRWYIAFTGNNLGSVLSAVKAGSTCRCSPLAPSLHTPFVPVPSSPRTPVGSVDLCLGEGWHDGRIGCRNERSAVQPSSRSICKLSTKGDLLAHAFAPILADAKFVDRRRTGQPNCAASVSDWW